ncbi:MAG: metal ABC transporter permease [Clostridia bacterium]|nr:metal ABC transporter permease [Clostridia bacterium]
MEALISYYKTFPVVRYSTVVIILVSLCAALLGVSLVLKRFSMIGDGLSHVAFGATAIAAAAGFAPLYVALPVTVIAAVLLLGVKSSKIMGDAAIAMISAGALAVGYLMLNLFPSNASTIAGDACTTLFGSSSIIGIGVTDVIVCSVLAAAVIFIFIFFYHKIFAITFDEGFATATGTKARVYNTLLAAVTGIVIVLAMKMVGALLISALITFPALSAMRVFKTFKKVVVCSAIISVSCALLGIIVCITASTPIGPTIAVANILVFAGFFTAGKLIEKK